jgi:hypothetical protein
MKPEIAKMAVKGAIGLVFSAAIGYIVKAEHKIDDRIDAHYASKDATPES